MGWSVQQRAGLTHHRPAGTYKGYTLFAPMQSDAAYLLDLDGRIVHRWCLPGARLFHPQLLPSGQLLVLGNDAPAAAPERRPDDHPPQTFAERLRLLGGNAGQLWELAWDSRVVWAYTNPAMHHDCIRLERGTTLIAVWAELPVELARAVRGGARGPRQQVPTLIADEVVEIDARGTEVARLPLWQQLDPVRDPICPLEPRWEWTHLNSLALMPDGSVLFSCRNNSRVGILERPSGRLRWKFGAPAVFHQHHASALANGHVQIFDNGMHRLGTPFSRVVEVNPTDSTVVWEYTGEPPEQFFSGHLSSAERLPNENVLVCEGTSGRLFEVTPRGETVWEWISPFLTPTWTSPFMNLRQGSPRPWIFRAYRYGPEFPGLAGRSLDPAAWATLNRLYGL